MLIEHVECPLVTLLGHDAVSLATLLMVDVNQPFDPLFGSVQGACRRCSTGFMSLEIIRRSLPNWGWGYGPPGDGPFPAIMLLHGSEGSRSGMIYRTAAILAAHGFLAMAFPYSNGSNAGDIIDVPLDRTAEALSALRAHSLVGNKVGLYGISRGAEHALLLAALMARDGVAGLPDAIAVHTPPDVICGAYNSRMWRDSGDPGWRSWDPADRAWTWRGSSDALLPTTTIEIERFDGPLFLSHGTRDATWSVEMTRRLWDRLKRHGRTPEVHLFEGEGHGVNSEVENQHNELLIDFFARHLGVEKSSDFTN